jgi:putative FmdB family regulatory protein
MPIYEYQCSGCGHRLEAIQRFSDAPLTDCPDCGKARLKKLISAAGFRLSGNGWYETDFKNNKQRNLVQKDSAEGEKTAKSSDSGDSKRGGLKRDKESTSTKSAATTASSAASST